MPLGYRPRIACRAPFRLLGIGPLGIGTRNQISNTTNTTRGIPIAQTATANHPRVRHAKPDHGPGGTGHAPPIAMKYGGPRPPEKPPIQMRYGGPRPPERPPIQMRYGGPRPPEQPPIQMKYGGPRPPEKPPIQMKYGGPRPRH